MNYKEMPFRLQLSIDYTIKLHIFIPGKVTIAGNKTFIFFKK